MIDDDDWSEPDPEYHNEPTTCRHGIAGECEWCMEDREDWG